MDTKNDHLASLYSKIQYGFKETVYRPTTNEKSCKDWKALEALTAENGYSKPKDTLFLWITAVVTDLTIFCVGISFSWTSPVFPKLDALDSPLGKPTTADQKSLIATLMCVGAMLGPLVAGKLADFLGRKKTLILLSLPMLAAFFILAFATNVYFFYLARFLHGLSVGTIMALLSMYTGEISEPHNRGKFGCIVGVFVTAGILYPYMVGPYMSVKWFSISCSIPLIVFFAIFPIFMPESPYFLISINRTHQAERALMKLRQKSLSAVQKEILEITEMIEDDKRNKGGLKDLFYAPELRKSLIISGGLAILQQLSGINAVTGYLHTIFEATGTIEIIHPNISTMIVGCIKVLTTTATAFVVERLGRRLLLLGSCLGCAISLILFGAFFFLQSHNIDLSAVWWLPLCCMMVYIVAFNLGLGPLTITVMSEIFPSSAKSVASSLITSTLFGAQAIITMVFPIIAEALGLAMCFWLFGVFCFLGIIFVCFVVPETKGKTLAEIQKMLSGKSMK